LDTPSYMYPYLWLALICATRMQNSVEK